MVEHRIFHNLDSALGLNPEKNYKLNFTKQTKLFNQIKKKIICFLIILMYPSI